MDKKTGRLRIEKCPDSYSVCTGCGTCEMICAMMHDGVTGPGYRRIIMQQGPTHKQIFHVFTCQQCEDAACYLACPKKDKALFRDERDIVCVNEEECIGCGKCVKACIYQPPRISVVKAKDKNERKAKKCDLCKDRPEGPACVEWCPAKCLAINDKPLPWEQKGGEA